MVAACSRVRVSKDSHGVSDDGVRALYVVRAEIAQDDRMALEAYRVESTAQRRAVGVHSRIMAR